MAGTHGSNLDLVEVRTRVPATDLAHLLEPRERQRKDAEPSTVRGPWAALRRRVGVHRFAHIPRLAGLVGQHRGRKVEGGGILCSPDGIFSHHANRQLHISDYNGMTFQEPFDKQACRPRHAVLHFSSFEEAAEYMQLGEKGQRHPVLALMHDQPTYRYFRQNLPPDSRRRLLDAMGLPPARHAQVDNLSVYISDKGCLTNFHWDRSSGIIIQFHGRKRVWLVAPEHDSFMVSGDANRSISACFRRSRFTGREELPEVPHTSVVLGPGEALFIPPLWWHQVESLDEETTGMIVRFDDKSSHTSPHVSAPPL